MASSFVHLTPPCSIQVAGTSGKIQLDGDSDDEGPAHESYGEAILEVLGAERRAELLAALYMARNDAHYTVGWCG